MPGDLTSCLAQLRGIIHPDDASAILAAAREARRAGRGTVEAAREAVTQHRETVRGLAKAGGGPVKIEPAEAKSAPGADGGDVRSAAAARVAAEMPDVKVTHEGEVMSAKDALAKIGEAQKQDLEFADLVQVAAQCAIGG